LAPVAGSLTPPRAPVGSDPALRLVLRNGGGSALLLDTRTTLQAAGRSAALAVPAAIAADSVAELTFAPLDLDAIAPGRLALQLAARGVQNGAPFAQDLALPDSLLWFEPAALTILGVVPSQTSVTRDQTEPWNLDVLLLNSGQSQYRIDAAAVRIVLGGLDRTDSYTLVRQKPGLGLVAPAALDTLRFQVTRTGPDVGPATLEASLRATDLQSGRSLEVDTYLGGKGSVRVQYPAQPVLGALTATQPTIVAGQTRGVDCRLDIRNDGEAALLLDTEQLAASLATTPPVPFAVEVASGRTWLGAGESLALKYRLGPFAVGAGPLVLQAAPRLVEANRNVALAVAASETLLVQTPRSAGGDRRHGAAARDARPNAAVDGALPNRKSWPERRALECAAPGVPDHEGHRCQRRLERASAGRLRCRLRLRAARRRRSGADVHGHRHRHRGARSQAVARCDGARARLRPHARGRAGHASAVAGANRAAPGARGFDVGAARREPWPARRAAHRGAQPRRVEPRSRSGPHRRALGRHERSRRARGPRRASCPARRSSCASRR
jgi:hypothetical protein